MNCRDVRTTDTEKSDVVAATQEALMVDLVATRRLARLARQQGADSCAADWNVAHAAIQSFADEHSTL